MKTVVAVYVVMALVCAVWLRSWQRDVPWLIAGILGGLWPLWLLAMIGL